MPALLAATLVCGAQTRGEVRTVTALALLAIGFGLGVGATLAAQACDRWVGRQFGDALEEVGDPVHGRSPVHSEEGGTHG